MGLFKTLKTQYTALCQASENDEWNAANSSFGDMAKEVGKVTKIGVLGTAYVAADILSKEREYNDSMFPVFSNDNYDDDGYRLGHSGFGYYVNDYRIDVDETLHIDDD